MNLDFKNESENKLKINNKKSCICSRNRVSHKIALKAISPRNGPADSVGVKNIGLKSRMQFYLVYFI